METKTVGRSGLREAHGVVTRRAEGQEPVLEREGGIEERLLAGPLGLEQSYWVRERPEGRGPLEIVITFDGLTPEAVAGASDSVLLRDKTRRVRGGYRELPHIPEVRSYIKLSERRLVEN